MESLGKLTGGIAHDFNNLLMAIMGSLELLRKKLPREPMVDRLIGGALQSAERGASLSQRMLAFARQQDLTTRSSNISDLLDGMRELLERTLGTQIELSIRIPPRLPDAEVDVNQVELAILNLVINSRDAMSDRGAITIDAGESALEADKAIREGHYIWVKVTDTGSGMDAGTLKKAVEPFFSTKPVGKGTGLGLSMVHGLASQLGGKLELSSDLGKGTAATLWFPVSTSHADVKQRTQEAIPVSAARSTILVVDDDPLIAMNAVDMLEELGHTAIEANSGKQALEILKAGQHVDLIVTDHSMPGMTGTELAAVARREHPEMPILLATGYADLPHGQKSDLPRLSKPYLQAQLEAEVNRLLAPIEPVEFAKTSDEKRK